MQIAELKQGNRILCCEVEHTVKHVVLNHPAGVVVITEDEAAISENHLNKNGWTLVPRCLTERVG